MEEREQKIIDIVERAGSSSSQFIYEQIKIECSYATLKRDLAKLVKENYISVTGRGKATKYSLSPLYSLLSPIDVNSYFALDVDERKIKKHFNFGVIREVISSYCIFNNEELEKLANLEEKFKTNIKELTTSEYKKEFERLAIDLSWKSSQIEGNTYSLLETERLLIDKQTAAGKTKEEAIMLLNHKDALDFLLEQPNYLEILSISKVEDIHHILTKELSIDRNIRNKRVGISGTNYKPLDNLFQIKEALDLSFCVINGKNNVYEKALLALVLISYIQPFMDGNKRTARIVSNAILINGKYCPMSYRTVDSLEYKKAMLLFYEQNNLSAMKQIFIDQYEFAVNSYF
ncbi:MAG: Fic family protein [Chitinophagales bacterium]|nr:Fic family protein [Chitinophagales bacterium]